MTKAFTTAAAFLYVTSAKPHNGIFTGTENVIGGAISRIFGGEPVTSATEYPFFLTLVVDEDGVDVVRCGATLIAPKIALTAASCVTNFGKVNFTNISIFEDYFRKLLKKLCLHYSTFVSSVRTKLRLL